MMHRAGLLLLMLLCITRAELHAAPTSLDTMPGVQIVLIPVLAQTPAEARAFLSSSGPPGEDGRRYDAYTEWEIRWKWPVVDHKPQFDKLKVETSVKVTLPEWAAPTKDIQQAWDVFIDQLKEHEAGHVRQAFFHARKVEQALKSATKENPNLTAKQANAIARRIIHEARRADETYDDLTNHGLRQGVRWP